MSFVTRALDPNNLRPLFSAVSMAWDLERAIREDVNFVRLARRALLPLPFDRERPLDPVAFPAPARLDLPALAGKRVGVVASGGSGATAAIVGVQRAFEEGGIEPIAISASSGSALFSMLWASGFDAEAVARFWLSLRRADYVDPDWPAFVRSSAQALRGWAGLLRGEAIEKSVRGFVGDKRLGDARIPFTMVVWNVDRNRVEYLGTRETPDVPVALAARVAIAIPVFVEPVRLGDHLYGDGGVVDIFPARPVVEANPDLVFGVNSYLPEGFEGEDVSGWRQKPLAVFHASGQLRWSGMLALAREQAKLAGDRLVLIHPVPYADVRGARFYETFVDRSRWADYMRAGRTSARAALVQWKPKPVRGGSGAPAGSASPREAP